MSRMSVCSVRTAKGTCIRSDVRRCYCNLPNTFIFRLISDSDNGHFTCILSAILAYVAKYLSERNMFLIDVVEKYIASGKSFGFRDN
jgi:hypothetical protein